MNVDSEVVFEWSEEPSERALPLRSCITSMYDVRVRKRRENSSSGRLSITRLCLYLAFVCVVLYVWKVYLYHGNSESYFLRKEIDHGRGSVAAINEPLTLWSTDFHISPIADIKHILKEFNVHVIDKSLSGHCYLSNTCEKDLKVITKDNGIRLSPCPNALRRDFYDAYKRDPEFQSIDAVVCTHAASMCELYMPFKKPMIIIASTRYEIGRLDAKSWTRWNVNLEKIASKPYNTIAANNAYDLEYIKYFTNLQNVILLPNFCDYVNAKYKPTKREILIGPARGINSRLLEDLKSIFAKLLSNPHTSDISDSNSNSNANSNTNTNTDTDTDNSAFPALPVSPDSLYLSQIRELYPLHYEYSDIAAHRAMVLLPYQVSVMSFFEYYRMELPMFVPSPALLTDWHLSLRVLNERTWSSVYGMPAHKSVLSKHPNSSSTMRSDPNNEFDKEAILEWLQLSDFYVWPHIEQFDSFEDLALKLTKMSQTRLDSISHSMHLYNIKEEKNIKGKWSEILSKVNRYNRRTDEGFIKSNGTMTSTAVEIEDDINKALWSEYEVRLSDDCNDNN